MRPRRKSKIFELAFALALTACGGALDTSLEMKDATRHPDGVLVEPAPAIPPAEEHGSAGAGVVALRTPVSDEQIGDVVHKYVRAFTEGNIDAFDDLLDDNAVLFGDNGHSQARPMLLQSLQARYRQHVAEYRAIHDDIARLDRIERWSSDDLGPFSDPPRPVEMRKGDVLVRVPLDPQTSLSTGDPLFRSTLVLLLRRGSDRALKIAGLAETDTP
ncbi:MAG TPA: nuclear transport factor 2 family protein [Polyangiaceae bacterium]